MAPERSDALVDYVCAVHRAGPASGRPEAPSPPPPQRARCLRLMLSVLVTVSLLSLSLAPAAAAPGKAPHRRQGHAVATAPKHSRPDRPVVVASKHARPDRPVTAASKHARPDRPVAAASKRVRPDRPAHARHVRTRPARERVHAHRGTAVHAGVVPLVNATWDNPALPPVVLTAIRDAARDKGLDPGLLMALAWRESRFDPQARNRRSSATGLMQFTSETWLRSVREFGARHGAGEYAAAIRKEPSGEHFVGDPRLRTAILEMRADPVLSARLAAETLEGQRAAMRSQLRRDVRAADLYLRHVLGPSGAARFLDALARRPSASALEVASGTTLRNAGLLARDGRPMTVAGTYAAVRAMLASLRTRSGPILAAAG